MFTAVALALVTRTGIAVAAQWLLSRVIATNQNQAASIDVTHLTLTVVGGVGGVVALVVAYRRFVSIPVNSGDPTNFPRTLSAAPGMARSVGNQPAKETSMDFQEQIDAARREFDQIDTDHDGFITFDEAMQWGMTQNEDFADTMDRHRQQAGSVNGRVSFQDFLRYKELIDAGD
ncbi:EF-hand domain-containing protein [Nocardia tengchongensis]|uniref:EF-hand domain-containing protein n=1 Tax=Nocardia tengchongensis TaxID=2055889 RepID=UPI00367B4AC0